MSLSKEERVFFRMVQEAAFCNPFSRQRFDLDLRIADGHPGAGAEPVDIAIAAVKARVQQLIQQGKGDLTGYSSERDRQLVRSGILFDLFHRCADAFDLLIMEQLKREDSCPVPFAREALGMMKQRGFTPQEAVHYFAFMYQLRRAFFFIFKGLIGQSPSMEDLRCRLWNNLFTHDSRLYETYLWNRMEDFSLIILGETGTGKGTAAAAIGRSGYIPFDEKSGCFSAGFNHNFIAINLSQFPESIIESELFGHKKGAFTGATSDHQGVLSRCPKYGTIFLDEIGDVSVPIQIKLLQVLQERTFTRVGDHAPLQFHGRVIAATNRPLAELRRQGRFRDDFYYRLCSDVITTPSLRDQIRENPACFDEILGHTVDRIMGGPCPELHRTIGDILNAEPGRDYSWPGNVRELEQAIRSVLITRRYESGSGSDSPALQEEDRILRAFQEGSLDAHSLLEDYCTMLYRKHGTYEAVSRITRLDRRTVKKNIRAGN